MTTATGTAVKTSLELRICAESAGLGALGSYPPKLVVSSGIYITALHTTRYH